MAVFHTMHILLKEALLISMTTQDGSDLKTSLTSFMGWLGCCTALTLTKFTCKKLHVIENDQSLFFWVLLPVVTFPGIKRKNNYFYKGIMKTLMLLVLWYASKNLSRGHFPVYVKIFVRGMCLLAFFSLVFKQIFYSFDT